MGLFGKIKEPVFLKEDSSAEAQLLARHATKKIRSAGGRLKGPAKRTRGQDTAFEPKLIEMLGFKV